MHNLLTDPLITVRLAHGQETVCLPELLVLLDRDAVEQFPRLLPHQRHSWHALLVQLACLALWEKEAVFPQNAEDWRAALRAMTPGFADDEPWHLLGEDHRLPAFLQPPALDGSPENWAVIQTPDELDVLVTSRNHGVKQKNMNAPVVEDWLLALVSLQTHGPSGGSGNYGIARQNGGYGTRPGFSLVSALSPGGQWARDVRVILANKAALLSGYPNPRLALLWLEAWDGKSSLPLTQLHPLFIEVCRRIRLFPKAEGIEARKQGTSIQRVQAKESKGNVGDPWVPIHHKEGKAFGVKPVYANLAQIIGQSEYSIPLLARQHPQDPDMGLALQCRILVRGMGATEGYMERLIPIEGKAQWFARDETGAVAKTMVELAKAAQFKVLKPALLTYIQGRKEKAPGNDSVAAKSWLPAWTVALDQEIDAAFFPALWKILARMEAGQEVETALECWTQKLRDLALKQLEEGLQSLPCGGLQAEVKARGRFMALCRKFLPLAQADKVEADKEDS